DPDCASAYAELREVIPLYAYLLVDPQGWEGVLGQAWKNIAARRHARQHYVFRQSAAPGWRDRVPEGMRAVQLDADFFNQDGLENHGEIMDWIDSWRSREDFLARGVGTCLVHANRIAAWSLMDCALGDRCEIGVVTDRRYRRQGLGSLVVSAAVDACLARGYREIGWQCLSSNAGSIAVALRTGFVKERDYQAFSSWLPAESSGDLTRAEYEDWALHYERSSERETGWAFLASEAWAEAGDTARALACLGSLQDAGWKGQREWFDHNWHFDGLRNMAEFQNLRAGLVEE
ncbi:MAG: GNAT family N-acetyltransferase, partial [Chloroflexi bacterium]